MKVVLLVLAACACVNAVDFNFQPSDVVTDKVEGHWQNNVIVLHAAGEEGDDSHLVQQVAVLEKAQGRNIITDAISNLLENFRDIVWNGSGDIPPLDPLLLSAVGPFDFTTTGVRVSASARDINLSGLGWFVVDDISFNVLRLNFGFHMTVPRLTLTGAYDVRARLALLINHHAGGDFRVFVNRIEVGVDGRLGTNIFGGGHLTLREFAVKIDIHDTQISIQGMVGSNLINGFINSFIQNLSQSVIQDEVQNVSDILSRELFEIINDILKDFTLADILP